MLAAAPLVMGALGVAQVIAMIAMWAYGAYTEDPEQKAMEQMESLRQQGQQNLMTEMGVEQLSKERIREKYSMPEFGRLVGESQAINAGVFDDFPENEAPEEGPLASLIAEQLGTTVQALRDKSNPTRTVPDMPSLTMDALTHRRPY